MNQAVELEKIQTKIYEIRGQKVILDRDLASFYSVDTRYLNKAVKRNSKRFPEKYVFQLNRNELDNLMFQFGTSSWGGLRKAPYVFTEHGVLMTASILKSDIAIEVNQRIIEVFVELRKEIKKDPKYELLEERLKHFESRLDNIELSQRIDSKIRTDKVISLSKEVRAISELFDDFQDAHVIIKRPDNFK